MTFTEDKLNKFEKKQKLVKINTLLFVQNDTRWRQLSIKKKMAT